MRIGSALLMCGVLLQAPACAAPPYDAGPVGSEDGYTVSTQDVDPPGRVGRLSEVLGQVWLYSPEDREWVTAERNRPLTTGDRIATDALARAEMRVGSTVIRLDSNSELEVLRLDDDHLHLQLHRGASLVRLRDSELAGQFEMVTAEGRFRTDRAGGYRFDRNDKSAQATVISGRLTYEGRNQALTIDREQRAEFLLDAHGRAQYAIIEPKRDAFAACGAFPNVFCKLSGMVTEADWANWSPADLKPYIDEALEVFGPDRLMYGSDWPVCELAASYGQVHDALETNLAALSESEKSAIFSGTARAFYSLPD